jgi:hypothetical protein
MADELTVGKDPDGTLHLMRNGVRTERVYRMKEALAEIGITAPTYYRWVKSKQIDDVALRDRAQWRLFTREEIDRIKAEAGRVQIVQPPE